MAHRPRRAGWRLLSTVSATAALLVGAAPAAAAPGRPPVLNFDRCTAEQKDGFQCATARRVPLDYDHPRGPLIRLAVIRHRATDRARPLGTLFFNPGGPGAPGTDLLPSVYDDFPRELRARFDIASWDPRGVGSSTAVQCFASERDEARFVSRIPVGFPVGEAERRAWTRRYARFNRRCGRRNGRLLEHVSTADTARDLDLLRRAVGDRRLNYYGASYGTFLGATYANLFPRRVGRMVLDANLDPVAWTRKGARRPFLTTFLRTRADEGAAETLGAFLDLCGRAGTAGCAFSAGSPEATQAKWTTLLERVRSQPVSLGTAPEPMSYGELALRVIAGLYRVDPGWTATAELMQSAWTASEAPALTRAPGPTDSPIPRPGRFAGVGEGGGAAVLGRRTAARDHLRGEPEPAQAPGLSSHGRACLRPRRRGRPVLYVAYPALRKLAGQSRRSLRRTLGPPHCQPGAGNRHHGRPGHPVPGRGRHGAPPGPGPPADRGRLRAWHLDQPELLRERLRKRVRHQGAAATEGHQVLAGPATVQPGALTTPFSRAQHRALDGKR